MQDEWKLGHAGRMGYLDVIAGLTAEPLWVWQAIPIRNCKENLLSRRWNFGRIYRRFLRSTLRFLVLHLMFLIFSFCFEALRCLLPKRKSRPRSDSTIQNHIHLAFCRSHSRLVEFLHLFLSKRTSQCHNKTRFLKLLLSCDTPLYPLYLCWYEMRFFKVL